MSLTGAWPNVHVLPHSRVCRCIFALSQRRLTIAGATGKGFGKVQEKEVAKVRRVLLHEGCYFNTATVIIKCTLRQRNAEC